jgi:hypothetical protein
MLDVQPEGEHCYFCQSGHDCFLIQIIGRNNDTGAGSSDSLSLVEFGVY